MKSMIRKTVVLAVAVAMGAGGAWAQFSANYQTNTINGVGVKWPGDYTVGSNTCFNVLEVLNGGTLTNTAGHMGFTATASNNLALVSGAGSIWTNTSECNVGYSGSGNRLIVTNGGQVANANGFVGRNWAAAPTLDQAEVSGAGSVWRCIGYLAIGNSAAGNRLRISDGGRVYASNNGIIGQWGDAKGNEVVVAGNGSLWQIGADLYLGKNALSSNNRLIITNGGTVADVNGFFGNQATANSNIAVISGSGSSWTNTGGCSVGLYGSLNEMSVDNGALVFDDSGYLGNYPGANSNRVVVSGSGSVWTNKTNFTAGGSGVANSLVITNGGVVYGRYSYAGSSSNGNRVVVSGANSRWDYFSLAIGQSGGSDNQVEINCGATVAGPLTPSQYSYVVVGGKAGFTGNVVRVGDGGVFDFNTLIVTNAGNSVLNSGGIYQFSSTTPTITTNGTEATSPIVLTNGIISFRNLANAPLGAGTQLARITYQGDNGYRLNGATNASVASYLFDSVANTGNAANYQRLHLTGLNPRWQSTVLTVGLGGALWATNTQATVSAVFTNNGTLRVVNATLAFSQAATLNGTVSIGLDRLATTNGAVLNTALTLGASSTLQLSGGTYTNAQDLVLFRYSGTRSGVFATETGVPPKYKILYGPETDGWIRLVRAGRGTVVVVQ